MYSIPSPLRVSFALILSALSTSLVAQPRQAPGETSVSVGITGLSQFNTRIVDGGGSFNWQDGSANVSVTRQVTSAFSAGVNARYNYQKWSWSDPQAFGGQAPWTAISTPALGMSFGYSPSPEWRIGFSPTVEWSGETGTGTGGTATYGAVMSVARTFSKDLTLGVGAGVFRQIDETKVFPYLLVNWNITDKLRLGNSLPAGPAGGAGLELSYAMTERWSIAAGGAYRSYRFRLNENSPVANGIGQNSFVPVFARLSYAIDRTTRVDLYAAATTAGRLSATDTSGTTQYSTNYQTGFAMALSLSKRF
ncbi:DUF6268 family outer membrane beta-barrel protein [Zwartia vadi]|uniref:DUF6268 family outer membrane beta-barrel protein n=1 Tax=Zwartia vadi TaxID=3058168 RepID=UPI0025B328E9|nr:DUF6268 family outer membrane beta-barrel protein [Zwartia vadi]MDN3987657.1 DUF6268 family outer membrane beta-barrel protein [Zwartia vadi]